jgi:hypothetical protein
MTALSPVAGLTEAEIVLRAGGWFVEGETFSGPWNTKEAAQAARALDYDTAHLLHNSAKRIIR